MGSYNRFPNNYCLSDCLSRSTSRYSLAALLLLVGCSALMLAATRSAFHSWIDTDAGLACSAIGAAVGAAVGGVVGSFSRRWFTGGILGLLCGVLVGGMAGAQMAGPPDLVVVSAGIAIVLVFSFILRPAVDAAPEPSRSDDSARENGSLNKHPLDRD
jgi:hypothetical protein